MQELEAGNNCWFMSKHDGLTVTSPTAGPGEVLKSRFASGTSLPGTQRIGSSSRPKDPWDGNSIDFGIRHT